MEDTPPGISPGPRELRGATARKTKTMFRLSGPPNQIDTRESERYLA
jgi:hypothetical protein